MNSILETKWQCEFCSHSLTIDPKHIDIINIAKVRHLLDTHKKSVRQVLKYDEKLAYALCEFFGILEQE